MLPLLSAADPISEVTGPAVSVLSQSVMGALLVLSWILTILAVRELIKVQNARIHDKTDDSRRIEQLSITLKEIHLEMHNQLKNIARTQSDGHRILEGVKYSVDTVVLSNMQNNQQERPRYPHRLHVTNPKDPA